MKIPVLLLSLCVIEYVAAAAITSRGKSSEAQTIKALEENTHLLPLSTRRILAARRDQSSTESPFDPPSYINPPISKVPDVQMSKSRKWPGAVKKKIRYGPYRIPPISEDNLESRTLNLSGVANLLTLGGEKPCTSECVLHSLAAAVEYDDGSPAVLANGAWLHHTVLWNVGPEVNDAVCRSSKIDVVETLGGYLEFETGWGVEHVFQAGNERTDVEFSVLNSTIPLGYHLRQKDEFVFNVELMNMHDREKWVWLTLTFDYLEGPHPEYKEGKVLWMSVGPNRCGGSNSNPFGASNLTKSQQPTKETFTEHSIPWVAPADGWIMGGNGHLHEGGVSLSIYKNGQTICTSYPHYAKIGPGNSGGMSHGHNTRRTDVPTYNNTEMVYIEEQGGCIFEKPFRMNKGDSMHIGAAYDFTKYSGMRNKRGELDNVMGIVGSLIAFDKPLKLSETT